MEGQGQPLDGRTLEGGGQLVRLLFVLAALLQKPIRVDNIRAGRPGGGGLKGQHLASVGWLAQACSATIEGLEVGSRSASFMPLPPSVAAETTLDQSPEPLSHANRTTAYKKLFKRIRLETGQVAHETRIDLASAGAISLVVQGVLPFLLFSPLVPQTPIVLTVTGGTNVSMSPSVDHVVRVLGPVLSRLFYGQSADAATTASDRPPVIELAPGRKFRRGWSHGRRTALGSVSFLIHPVFASSKTPLSAFDFPSSDDDEAMSPLYLEAVILAPDYACAQLLESTLLHTIATQIGPVKTTISSEITEDPKRWYLLLVAEMGSGLRVAADWLYNIRIRPDSSSEVTALLAARVVKNLAKTLRQRLVFDEHMRDQIVVFQALMQGHTKGLGRERSLHARTAEWTIEQTLGVSFDDEGGCTGVGWSAGTFQHPLVTKIQSHIWQTWNIHERKERHT